MGRKWRDEGDEGRHGRRVVVIVGRILALEVQGELPQRLHGASSRHFPTVLSPTHAASDETGYEHDRPCDEGVDAESEDEIGLAPSTQISVNLYHHQDKKAIACTSVMG
jgi:hypothetical protein